MRRLTGVRKPELPGFHQQLFVNQQNFIRDHTAEFDNLAKSYEPYFADYQGAEIEALEHHADPHIKRELRIQAMEEMRESGIYVDTEDLWVKKVWWKLKKNEYAKAGKKPRSIGDLGVSASLLGFRLTNFLKTAQSSEVYEYKGGHIAFCKSPDPFELKRHFENLLHPPGRFYFLYFSDDSCLSIYNPTTSQYDLYNLDISSCDASHGQGIFDLLSRMMPEGDCRHDMDRLIKQCQLPLKIIATGNKNVKVVMQPTRPMLYSGSTITTAINNLANISIAMAIADCNYTGHLVDGVAVEIVGAASTAGYILSGCKPLEYFEDVQFLKNSPVKDIHGEWQPMINFGVFLRAAGTCNGDLPGRGHLRPRAEAFQRGLIKCTFPYTRSPFISVLRKATGEGETTVTRELEDHFRHKVVDNPEFPPYDVDVDSFCLRYRLDSSDYADLLHDYCPMTFGQHYSGSFADKILAKDYDLDTVSEYSHDYFILNNYHSSSTEASF